MSRLTNQEVMKQLFENESDNLHLSAGEFIDYFYPKYLDTFGSNNSRNGTIFENLIVMTLIREGLAPVYIQATLAFVPNVIFDIVLYNRKTPIILSAKTSLRERWKQADIEAMALKYVHRKAECFVLTLNEREVGARRRDSNSYVGIDRFVLANTDEMDDLIQELKKIEFTESETIDVIEDHERKKVTKEDIKDWYKVKL